MTNSDGEAEFGPFLEALLRSWRGVDEVWRKRTLDDPFPRDIVLALVRRGKSSGRTVLLTGHYDTVSVENYGAQLMPLACDPEALIEPLIRSLKEEDGSNPLALRDLESGDFLPGRGLLDMKGGLAAGLAVLRRHAENPEFDGNILFAAVPDEEVASNGMRSLVRMLPDICDEQGLEITMAINLDAESDQGDGSKGRAIFLGSVGKMLPLVVFLGQPAHAGAPFDGVNPVLAMAEFIRMVESNPEHGDLDPGAPAPPVVLYARDTRTSYDVTMPAAAYCAVNVLTHKHTASEVLERFQALASRALAKAAERLAAARGGGGEAGRSSIPAVLRCSDLLASRGATRAIIHADSEPVEQSARIVIDLAMRTGVKGPAAVVGFAPPYYPRAEWNSGDQALRNGIDMARRSVERDFGVAIEIRPYFPGISDMSFLNPVSNLCGLDISRNCPVPVAAADSDSLRIPATNIGPWGRDYHQAVERIHAGYAFQTLPELLWRVAENALAPKG